ncbi:hypothetical protein [Sandarakinorhabdus sp.]|uniref:hypothetical protein n=1 Tax=Sandarakinorhabdus sp. TaxID=1916663 RepID=UPI003F6EEACA
MDPIVLAFASLGLAVIAALCAVAALLRSGSAAKAVAGLATAPPRENVDGLRRDLLARIGEIDEQFNAMARQLDALQISVSELDLAQRDAISAAAASASAAASGVVPSPPFEPAPALEPVAELAETDLAPVAALDPISEQVAAAPPEVATEAYPHSRVDELVAGYRAKIAERSRAPIREWLSQNNSFTLDATEDGRLIPSESGVIAAIPIGGSIAMLVPTASFVVDFATRFAGSQISLRQVMRNTFEAVADNSGDMKLQAPALARREGDHWVVEMPGRLGGFTDN